MNTGHVLVAGWGVELVMSDRKRYPSDVTDGQWALIGPFLEGYSKVGRRSWMSR